MKECQTIELVSLSSENDSKITDGYLTRRCTCAEPQQHAAARHAHEYGIGHSKTVAPRGKLSNQHSKVMLVKA
jgi:hypothetical protein